MPQFFLAIGLPALAESQNCLANGKIKLSFDTASPADAAALAMLHTSVATDLTRRYGRLKKVCSLPCATPAFW